MLGIIADDFTGAAELAGIGLRYNLKTELFLSVLPGTPIHADLLIACTDSRSMNKVNAEKITATMMQAILDLKPGFVYKKIDSVFRGHVLNEVRTEMKISGLHKALIIAANPSLGRTIRNGNYFINDKPIHETGFAYDPEFAITDSSVLKMVSANAGEVQVLKHSDKLPNAGIVIGEAVSDEDMKAWVNKTDNNWLLVGAGDFFTALLDKKLTARAQPASAIELPHLYVSGTAFNKSQEFISEVDHKLGCVAYLPVFMMQQENIGAEEWLNKVDTIVQSKRKIIVAISKSEKIPTGISAQSLRIAMAKAVGKVLERNKVKEIFIEGGSTAGAILSELKIETLSPVNELTRGVVRMKLADKYITVKPGSYELPEQIIELYTS
jgi:uncharacterized protein YgbK (DUF1537 family)